jgi:beta-phosphoglucomutase-like phosphatase (HAD superfamily)
MAPTVILLDIDGTLVDNTVQHIDAWQEAFLELGLQIDRERLRQNIGKGGDQFVPSVAGAEWNKAHGEKARQLHDEAYHARLSTVRPLPFVDEFLNGLGARRIRPVLATSSKTEEVAANLDVIGRKPQDFLVVDKSDVSESKPAPDVFAVALKKSGVSPIEAAAVGDTRWDGESASKLGVTFWGVLTGGGTDPELRMGKAKAVFPDLSGVLAGLK